MGSRKRLAITALSALGFAEALYMLTYEQEWIESLWCPFFGEGCNIVGRSEHAKHWGVPNAAAGVVGYAIMTTLALWPARERNSVQLRMLALKAVAGSASVASGFLLWEQKTKVHAWCFWCVSSAAINAALCALSFAKDNSVAGKASMQMFH